MPLATDVVSGERADEPLDVPCSARVQQRLGRGGLLCVGDGTRAAHATRALIALSGDDSVCPLPPVPLAAGELEAALARVWSGDQALLSVLRAQEQGEPTLMAQGSEYEGPMRLEVEGQSRAWRERRLVGRAVRHAEAAEVALRARVAQAKAQVEALNLRGRGRRRFAEIATFREAVHDRVQRHRVEDFLWRRYGPHTTTRPVRASKDRPA